MADEKAARASAVSLADVLRALGPDGADAIFRRLAQSSPTDPGGPFVKPKPCAAARLACRALRKAIDGSVIYLGLTLTPADAQHWRPGLLHTRWPRCLDVEVTVADVEGGIADVDAAALLALPFDGLRQPAAGATRIVRVALYSEEGGVLTGAESAIALVVQRLPWLAQLDLSGLDAADLSYEPEQLARMWQALAAAPELADLHLPSLCALAGAKDVPPWGGLRDLTVPITASPPNSTCAEAAAGLSQLTRLEKLKLIIDEIGSAPACLPPVLGSLPASVQELQLSFEDGRITTVMLSAEPKFAYRSTALADLARLAGGLLRSRTLGLRIQRLELPCIRVRPSTLPLGGDEEEPLRALVARAGVVEFGELVMEYCHELRQQSLPSWLQAVELLGKPARFRFEHPSYLTVHIKPWRRQWCQQRQRRRQQQRGWRGRSSKRAALGAELPAGGDASRGG